MSKETFQQNITHPKDPGSALTHFIGAILVIFAALPLLSRAIRGEHPIYIVSLCIFAISMFLLYSASTIYHTFNLSEKINRRLRKLDHMMIYVLIAGTYTPICLVVLRSASGSFLFLLVWSIAILGIIQCIFFINCPKWVSALLYIAMGWLCVFSFDDITALLNKSAFGWLLAGGIAYTIGAILFGVGKKLRWMHSVFHIFVLLGSVLQFVAIYFYVL